jgi:lipid-A-disaccharide synthase
MDLFNEWRALLYFPLGIVPQIFFALRFLVQWVRSEKAGVSLVDALFWRLSLAGNLLSFLHYTIQGQYPFGLIQAGNGLIAWRNLNLMGKKNPCSTAKTLFLFGLFLSQALLLFAALEWSAGKVEWMHLPKVPFVLAEGQPSIFWHLLGMAGQGLFASRFWIQWWGAERKKSSSLGRNFWYLSLWGSLISAVYFMHIRDLISCLNQLFGIIPYIRNLILSLNISQYAIQQNDPNRVAQPPKF